MLSRVIRRPMQSVARRNMSLQSALGGIKQDIAATQKNKLDMKVKHTFLRGGKNDKIVFGAAVLLSLSIIVNVGRGFYKMATGQKS